MELDSLPDDSINFRDNVALFFDKISITNGPNRTNSTILNIGSNDKPSGDKNYFDTIIIADEIWLADHLIVLGKNKTLKFICNRLNVNLNGDINTYTWGLHENGIRSVKTPNARFYFRRINFTYNETDVESSSHFSKILNALNNIPHSKEGVIGSIIDELPKDVTSRYLNLSFDGNRERAIKLSKKYDLDLLVKLDNRKIYNSGDGVKYERSLTNQIGYHGVIQAVSWVDCRLTNGSSSCETIARPINFHNNLSSALVGLPAVILSRWRLEWLERMVEAIDGRGQEGDTGAVISLLRRIKDGLRLPIIDQDRARYNQLNSRIEELKRQYLPEEQAEIITVRLPNGESKPVLVFFRRSDLRVKIAPTHLYVREGRRNIIGLLTFDDENIEKGTISFVLEFRTDPFLRSLVRDKLQRAGIPVAEGTFSDWKLTADEITAVGIIGSKIEGSGNQLNASIQLQRAAGQIALWKLVEIGLPLRFVYKTTTGEPRTGTIETNISLVARTKSGVTVAEGKVTNNRETPIAISYIERDGQFISIIDGPLVVQGKNWAPVPGSNLDTQTRIPPEAVVILDKRETILDDFDRGQAGDLITAVTVINAIGSDSRQVCGGALEFVNIEYVKYFLDDSLIETKGQFQLSSRSTANADKTLSFWKPRAAGGDAFGYKGRVVCENGYKDFGPFQTTDNTISITKERVNQ